MQSYVQFHTTSVLRINTILIDVVTWLTLLSMVWIFNKQGTTMCLLQDNYAHQLILYNTTVLNSHLGSLSSY